MRTCSALGGVEAGQQYDVVKKYFLMITYYASGRWCGENSLSG